MVTITIKANNQLPSAPFRSTSTLPESGSPYHSEAAYHARPFQAVPYMGSESQNKRRMSVGIDFEDEELTDYPDPPKGNQVSVGDGCIVLLLLAGIGAMAVKRQKDC